MPNSNVVNLYPVPNKGVDDQTLTVADSVVQFATAFNEETKYVVLDVQTADVRVTYDNSAPSSTNGHILPAGRSYTWAKATAQAAKFIRDGSISASIHASEFTI